MTVLTLIRAKEEDSGNYTMRVENGNQSQDISLNLEVKGQKEECPNLSLSFFFSLGCWSHNLLGSSYIYPWHLHYFSVSEMESFGNTACPILSWKLHSGILVWLEKNKTS